MPRRHGYYHSLYDARDLAALGAPLRSERTERGRAQLAADVPARMTQGSPLLSAALDLLPTFLHDPDLRFYPIGLSLLSQLHPDERPPPSSPRESCHAARRGARQRCRRGAASRRGA